LILAAATVALLWPSVASAKISKELRAELTEYVERHSKSEDIQARRAAILTRAILEGKKSVKALRPLLEDPDPRLRLAAAVALVDAGDRKAAEKVYKELDEVNDVVGALRGTVSLLGDKAEAKLLDKYLSKAAPERAAEVYRYLVAQDGALFDIVEKKARSKKDDERRAVARALVSSPRDRVVPIVEAMLKDRKNASVRLEGVRLAIAIHPFADDSAALATLLKASLDDSSQDVRLAAALELTSRDVVSGVRALAKIAAEQEEAPRKLEYLRLVNEAGVRGVPIDKASAKLFPVPDDRGDLAVESARLQALSGDNALLEKSIALFTDFTDYDGRLFAAKILGYSRSRAAAAELSKGLFEGSPQMRRLSARGLAVAAVPDSLPALKKALQRERDDEVLAFSVEAVGKIKSAESMQALRLLVTRASNTLKPTLIEALVRQKDPGAVATLKLLKRDLDEGIRWSASLAILELDEKEGRAALAGFAKGAPAGFIADIIALSPGARAAALDVMLTKSSPSTRSAVLSHMMSRPAVYEKVLVDLLATTSTGADERERLLPIVSGLKGSADTAAIEQVARSKSNALPLRQTAAWTIVRYPTKGMEATLRGYLASDEPSIQAIGMYGLASLND
jgi:HEAT repeat protein